MDRHEKRKLLETTRSLTLEGHKCRVDGWANDHATVTAGFAGYWHTSWETARRIIHGDGQFVAGDVTFASWGWQGDGAPIPEALQRIAKL